MRGCSWGARGKVSGLSDDAGLCVRMGSRPGRIRRIGKKRPPYRDAEKNGKSYRIQVWVDRAVSGRPSSGGRRKTVCEDTFPILSPGYPHVIFLLNRENAVEARLLSLKGDFAPGQTDRKNAIVSTPSAYSSRAGRCADPQGRNPSPTTHCSFSRKRSTVASTSSPLS